MKWKWTWNEMLEYFEGFGKYKNYRLILSEGEVRLTENIDF
jgi:hypothetical protein